MISPVVEKRQKCVYTRTTASGGIIQNGTVCRQLTSMVHNSRFTRPQIPALDVQRNLNRRQALQPTQSRDNTGSGIIFTTINNFLPYRIRHIHRLKQLRQQPVQLTTAQGNQR
jgi:hypothetical protein